MIIFAYATDDGSLEIFHNIDEALSYCEPIDIEEGNWLFWDENGLNMKAKILEPEAKRFLMSKPAVYDLVVFPDGLELIDFISNVTYVEGRGLYKDLEEVKRHLTRTTSTPAAGRS